MRRRAPALLLLVLAFGTLTSPSWSDTTVDLTPAQPYIDIPVEATAPTQITISTTTGTPQQPGFIDSWVELWQNATRIGADDDGGHGASNVLASFLTRNIEAGLYFVRATSFAWAVSGGTQTPTGSYLLNITGVIIPTPTPTPTATTEPTPTATPEPTAEPTPSATTEPEPTPTTSNTPTPIPTPEETAQPTPEPSTPQTEEPTSDNQEQTTPPAPIDEPPTEATAAEETTEPDPGILEEEPQPETSPEALPTDEPSLPLEDEPFFELDLGEVGAAISDAAAAIAESVSEAITAIGDTAAAAAEAFMAIGSDMTPEQRETSQTVVISAVVVTQIQALRRIK